MLLVQLFQQVGRTFEWRDALIVPIPKKGDLILGDNWRELSLLDVGRKRSFSTDFRLWPRR